jgi:hypothetical protein
LTPSTKQKPSKHLKTSHDESSSSTSVTSSSSTSIDVVVPQNNSNSKIKSNSNSNSNSSSNNKRRKSVSFNEVVMVRPLHHFSVAFHEVVTVRPVLHLSEYTDQEITDCWYVLADKQRIKADVFKTLQQYAKDKKENNETTSLCTRGLEKLSDGGRTRERRHISIREILEEQESQRQEQQETGSTSTSTSPMIYDTTRFRKIYKPHSRAARHVAQAMGKIDELAVTVAEEAVTSTNTSSSMRKRKPKN